VDEEWSGVDPNTAPGRYAAGCAGQSSPVGHLAHLNIILS
jgi:hypothetical protein